MAVMRAQVSLMFDDADLFENFITPCKEERRLNGIIVKCLKAYYLDERVRSMIEGGVDSEEVNSEEVKTTQSICDSIRAGLIMQNYLAEELKQTVEDGVEDIEGILSQTNKRAEDHGFGTAYQTKSGSTILQLEAPKQQAHAEAPSAPVNAGAPASDGVASILLQAVLMLAKDANNAQVTALLQQAGLSQQVVTPPAPVETARQATAPQVPMPNVSAGAGFVEHAPVVEFDGEDDFGGGNAIPAQPVAKPVEHSGEDASDALAGLMDSL